MAENKPDKNYNVQAVERALMILNCFTAEKHEWALTELAEKIEISKSTVFRIATTLQNHEYLKMGEDGKYRLGTEIYRLAAIDGQDSDMKSEAFPYMQELCEKYNETVVLLRYVNHRAICIAKIESDSALKITSNVGKESPLLSGATGKIIAAYLPEQELERTIAVQEALYETNQNREHLRQKLEHIRQKGFSISSSEVDMGVSAVAAPLFNYEGRIVGSISIAGPNFRFQPQEVSSVVQDLIRTCRKISQKLGFKL